MNIHVHIERLILDGLPIDPGQGARVRAVVERNLTHLLVARGRADRLTASGAPPRTRIGELPFPEHGRLEAFGARIARSVFDRIGNTERISGG